MSTQSRFKQITTPTATARRSGMLRLAAAATIALGSTGCMTTGQAERLDARFEAGWRPSKADCVFGGATPKLDAYCARLNFGSDGIVAILRSHNADILDEAAGDKLPCTEHVARARSALAAYGDDYALQELYSCDRDPPIENGRKVCHVSLMVTDRLTGKRFVVDNGHVFNPAITGGVGKYAEFTTLVDYAWTGETPTGVALGTE